MSDLTPDEIRNKIQAASDSLLLCVLKADHDSTEMSIGHLKEMLYDIQALGVTAQKAQAQLAAKDERVEKLEKTLQLIAEHGRGKPGFGYSCAKTAEAALKEKHDD